MQSWFGSGKSTQVAITTCCLSAWLLLGYDQGVFGGILQSQDWLKQFGYPSDTHTGIIVASFDVGCLLGCWINFVIGLPLGRRKTMWIASGAVIIGAALQASAFTIAHLVVGRIICGMGTGLNSSTVPMYQSELCPGRLRGRLVSAQLLLVGFGITIAYWFDFGMSYVDGSLAWRLPIAFQILFALVEVVLIFGVPESPRWLYEKRRDAEALAVLCHAHGKAADDEDILHEQRQILDAIALEEVSGRFKWTSVFKKDDLHTGRRVLLSFGAHFMNQMGGINLVVYYIPSVLVQNVGLTPKLAQILGGCINMTIVLGSFFPSLFLDRMGRRKTMIWGCTGVGISMMLISVLLSIGSKEASTAAVAFFFTYIIIFGASINCVPWVYAPEILTLESRTKGIALSTSSNWLWNFIIVMITPIIINRLQWKAYLIFMCTNFAFVPLFYFFYPETSNRTLEEIDFMFKQGTTNLPFSTRLVPSDIETASDSLKMQSDEAPVLLHIEGVAKE